MYRFLPYSMTGYRPGFNLPMGRWPLAFQRAPVIPFSTLFKRSSSIKAVFLYFPIILIFKLIEWLQRLRTNTAQTQSPPESYSGSQEAIPSDTTVALIDPDSESNENPFEELSAIILKRIYLPLFKFRSRLHYLPPNRHILDEQMPQEIEQITQTFLTNWTECQERWLSLILLMTFPYIRLRAWQHTETLTKGLLEHLHVFFLQGDSALATQFQSEPKVAAAFNNAMQSIHTTIQQFQMRVTAAMLVEQLLCSSQSNSLEALLKLALDEWETKANRYFSQEFQEFLNLHGENARLNQKGMQIITQLHQEAAVIAGEQAQLREDISTLETRLRQELQSEAAQQQSTMRQQLQTEADQEREALETRLKNEAAQQQSTMGERLQAKADQEREALETRLKAESDEREARLKADNTDLRQELSTLRQQLQTEADQEREALETRLKAEADEREARLRTEAAQKRETLKAQLQSEETARIQLRAEMMGMMRSFLNPDQLQILTAPPETALSEGLPSSGVSSPTPEQVTLPIESTTSALLTQGLYRATQHRDSEVVSQPIYQA